MTASPRFHRSGLTRRSLLGAAALVAAGARSFDAGATTSSIVSMDYALAETLITLGTPPIGLVEADEWGTWVVEPALPPGVRNIGNAQLPNFELISRLKPDLILTTPFLDAVEAPLRRVGPLMRISIYEEGRHPYEAATEATLLLGERLGRAAPARAFLAAADREFQTLGERLRRHRPPPLLLVNMMDGRHLRVHGGDGLFQGVLNRLGIENAYKDDASFWGFQTVGVERLAAMGNVHLVSFEPEPPDSRAILDNSPLWRELPFVKAGRISTLPAVNAFGAIPSALRLARLLVQSLEASY